MVKSKTFLFFRNFELRRIKSLVILTHVCEFIYKYVYLTSTSNTIVAFIILCMYRLHNHYQAQQTTTYAIRIRVHFVCN